MNFSAKSLTLLAATLFSSHLTYSYELTCKFSVSAKSGGKYYVIYDDYPSKLEFKTKVMPSELGIKDPFKKNDIVIIDGRNQCQICMSDFADQTIFYTESILNKPMAVEKDWKNEYGEKVGTYLDKSTFIYNPDKIKNKFLNLYSANVSNINRKDFEPFVEFSDSDTTQRWRETADADCLYDDNYNIDPKFSNVPYKKLPTKAYSTRYHWSD